MFKKDKTYVFALGGLGEVGKNMYVLMHNDEIVIIDAGVIFPEEELRGIDYVLPDFTFLKNNERKIKTLIITHVMKITSEQFHFSYKTSTSQVFMPLIKHMLL